MSHYCINLKNVIIKIRIYYSFKMIYNDNINDSINNNLFMKNDAQYK